MGTLARNRSQNRVLSLLMALALVLTMARSAEPFATPAIFAGDILERVESTLLDAARLRPADLVKVIFTENNPSDASLEKAVERSGGSVGRTLPIVGGFSAEIPAGSIPELGSSTNLRSLSEDRTGKFETVTFDGETPATISSNSVRTTGAESMWAAGNKGAGVGVAVIDTGVSPMNDLTARRNRVIHGPDLSGENNLIDTYGHGTVMAGIIGGDGYDSMNNASGAFMGIAPHAQIISLKVAGANGATDVSTVLAAMHWVAAYRDQYNIRVVNLSWGTHGTQTYKLDPLNYAVERLWQLGITVVVAAGNSGPTSSTITKPGDDPFVITVGAYNDQQNSDLGDDSVPGWSSRGPTTADGLSKPDVVAPGRLITSTRSYGSTVEKEFPKALYSPSYIRGSGSSQAAAAVSGAAALLIRQKPHLSPDQVKYAFSSTAASLPSVSPNIQGAGRINVASAAASANEGSANLNTEPSSGLGSLEASRGGRHIQNDCDGDGVANVIQGEITAQCQAWNGGTWTGGTWTGDSWTGGTWTGGTWTGGTWTGGTWTAGTWTAGSWTGGTWTAGTWTAGSWTNNDWAGGTWTGGTWTGGTWTGGSWTAGSWTAGTWTAGSWTGGTWTAGSWTGGTWTGGTWTAGTWTGGTWTGGTWTGGTWTTGEYDEFTSSGYDEFLTAFWGNRPPSHKRLAGEQSEPLVRYLKD